MLLLTTIDDVSAPLAVVDQPSNQDGTSQVANANENQPSGSTPRPSGLRRRVRNPPERTGMTIAQKRIVQLMEEEHLKKAQLLDLQMKNEQQKAIVLDLKTKYYQTQIENLNKR